MKTKIKLSELVKDVKRCKEICNEHQCWNCPLSIAYKTQTGTNRFLCAHNNFPVIKPELLEKEVEIEVSNIPDILTSEEKEYLSPVIKPIRDQVCDIYKSSYYYNEEYEEITIVRKVFENRQEVIKLYSFPKDTEFRGMELYKDYTPEELGL